MHGIRTVAQNISGNPVVQVAHYGGNKTVENIFRAHRRSFSAKSISICVDDALKQALESVPLVKVLYLMPLGR